jgi:hypothetical protein
MLNHTSQNLNKNARPCISLIFLLCMCLAFSSIAYADFSYNFDELSPFDNLSSSPAGNELYLVNTGETHPIAVWSGITGNSRGGNFSDSNFFLSAAEWTPSSFLMNYTFDATKNISFDMYIFRNESDDNSTNRKIFQAGGTADNDIFFDIEFSSGLVYFRVARYGYELSEITSDMAYIGKWTRYTLTYDTEEICGFVDNVSAGCSPVTITIGSTANSKGLFLGNGYSYGSPSGQAFYGWIDYFGVYDYILNLTSPIMYTYCNSKNLTLPFYEDFSECSDGSIPNTFSQTDMFDDEQINFLVYKNSSFSGIVFDSFSGFGKIIHDDSQSFNLSNYSISANFTKKENYSGNDFGFGLVFYDTPGESNYYTLLSFTGAFGLSGSGSAALNFLPYGCEQSYFFPQKGKEYTEKIEIITLDNITTSIKAKIWQTNETEPEIWNINCTDNYDSGLYPNKKGSFGFLGRESLNYYTALSLEKLSSSYVNTTYNNTLLVMGNSVGLGLGIDTYQRFGFLAAEYLNATYPSEFSGITEDNQCLGSSCLSDYGLCDNDGYPPVANYTRYIEKAAQRNPRYIFLLPSANDNYLYGVLAEDYKESLIKILDYWETYADNSTILLSTNSFFTSGYAAHYLTAEYNAKIREQAILREIPFLELHYIGNHNSSYLIDSIHPNALGHQLIASYLEDMILDNSSYVMTPESFNIYHDCYNGISVLNVSVLSPTMNCGSDTMTDWLILKNITGSGFLIYRADRPFTMNMTYIFLPDTSYSFVYGENTDYYISDSEGSIYNISFGNMSGAYISISEGEVPEIPTPLNISLITDMENISSYAYLTGFFNFTCIGNWPAMAYLSINSSSGNYQALEELNFTDSVMLNFTEGNNSVIAECLYNETEFSRSDFFVNVVIPPVILPNITNQNLTGQINVNVSFDSFDKFFWIIISIFIFIMGSLYFEDSHAKVIVRVLGSLALIFSSVLYIHDLPMLFVFCIIGIAFLVFSGVSYFRDSE